MSATNGVVTYLCEPNTNSYTSAQWWENVASLGVKNARVRIYGDDHNHLPLDLYQHGASMAQASSITLCGILDNSFVRPYLENNPSRIMYPNESLGYEGNKRRNRFIKEVCVEADRTAASLNRLGLTSFSIWNEPNLSALIPAGANVPPVDTSKAPSMSPENYYSMCYEVDGFLRAGGAKEVHLGALSWISGSGSDAKNPYCSGYIRAGLAYLKATGVTKLPWDFIDLNVEGWFTKLSAMSMVASVQAAFKAYGFVAPEICFSEWGVKVPLYNAVKFQETYDALNGIGSKMFFFSHPTTPDNYGATDWHIYGQTFLPGTTQTPFWPALVTLFGGGRIA